MLSPRARAALHSMVAALACSVALAQGTGTSTGAYTGTYTFQGIVLDKSGAIVPRTPVSVESPAGLLLQQTIADEKGSFVLPNLSPGDLLLLVPPFSGFAPRAIPLHVAASIRGYRIVLSPDAVNEEIAVAANQALSTDASDNRDSIVVTGNDLRKIPVFDQDYIAALTPFLDASSGSSGGVTLIVDGIEMKSVGVSPSAIQEVRINNDPYSAEFTRPGRGRIEITTKPGSPHFHGEANFLFRDSLFNAKNHFAVIRPPQSRRIYEGHLSGPAGRGGHTSFIASGARRDMDTAATVNAVGPNGLINENVLTPNRDSQASIRVTHDFSPAHRLSVGYNFERYTSNSPNVGGIVLPEAGYNLAQREDDAIFNDRLILTPNLINQLQITLEKDEDIASSITQAQSIQVSGSFIGGGAQADSARTENTMHLNEVVSWSHGIHYLRAGLQLPQLSRRADDDHTDRLGTYKFASLNTLALNQPYVFTAQQGPGRALYWINEFGSFLQDQIKLSPQLQLSLGLRYDWQTFLPDNNNLAPRISLAYAPGSARNQGKVILRAGTGVFYDRTGGDFPVTVKLHDGVVLRSVQIENPSYPMPGAALASAPTSLVRFSPGIRTPYAIQYSFGVERQIHKTVTVTAAYRGQVQVKAFRSRDANAPLLPPMPSLAAVYPRPDPALGKVQQIESGGRALLNALDLSFRGSAGRWFSGQAQYTLSRSLNNTSGINSYPQNQYQPNAEWGRADPDRLQRFNLIGNINPDHWLSVGVSATLYSGMPYTETTGSDDFHTGLGNARPPGTGRNTLETGGIADLDLLWSHDLRLTRRTGENARVLSPGLSAFNVLNRTNYANYIGSLSSPLFAQPAAALAGRQLQFSLGYRF